MKHTPYTTLINPKELQALMAQPHERHGLMVFDCSFELMKPAEGDAQFESSCIPGALRADLDRHLSAKGYPGTAPFNGGRHPLPAPHAFIQWLAACGLKPNTQVVVYDRQGANYCGRLWWMLKWVGHESVAVLDGGLQAWEASGGGLARGDLTRGIDPASEMKTIDPQLLRRPTLASVVSTDEIADAIPARKPFTLVDARARARYLGEVEPLDPVAGHIPSALNRPFQQNLAPDGTFKTPEELRQEFLELLDGRDPATVVHQCGSGVSAIPNLLAMEIAGLGRTALYPGSWSEWCSDSSRPVAIGTQT
ncbi:MAG: sulfurtransferase [Betaproteobacteria bacterium]|nr:sulfurtransferase [Betaproteobacteria bacterium]